MSPRLRSLALATALLGWPGVAAAADLMEIYRLAAERDPQLRGQMYQREAYAEDRYQAGAAYMPQIGFEMQRYKSHQEVISTDVAVYSDPDAEFWVTDWTLRLTQPIFRLENIYDYRRASARAEAAEYEYRAAELELMARVAELYFAVLQTRDELEFTRAEREAVEQNTRLIETKHAGGLVARTDLRDAQARLASVLASVVEAERMLEDAKQALAEVIGQDLTEEVATLRQALPLVAPDPADPEAWRHAAATRNPEVIAQQRIVDAAREEVSRERAGHAPTLDFVARRNSRDAGGSLFGGGSEIETTDLMLQLEVPIFSGGAVNSRTRQAQQMLAKAEMDLEAARRAAVRQAADSYRGVLSAISRVKASRQAVEAQELAREAKREGFRAGLFTLVAVLDAERDLHQARRDLAQARYEYLLDSLRLKQAAGNLADTDIAAVNNLLQ